MSRGKSSFFQFTPSITDVTRLLHSKDGGRSATRVPPRTRVIQQPDWARLRNAFDVNPACEVASRNLYQCRRRLFFLNKCLQR
ncbi:hypothetical protein Y032_0017g3433 [Ancylostoma ceylanicum]|nr:hypothetical protein Y032_0017g3433 [Ancylostoma ceylanicum]